MISGQPELKSPPQSIKPIYNTQSQLQTHLLSLAKEGWQWQSEEFPTEESRPLKESEIKEIFLVEPIAIEGLNQLKVVQVQANNGIQFALTDTGRVFSRGIDVSKSGILGLGGDIFETATFEGLSEFNSKKILTISLGQTHAAAIDENGDLYTWGRGSNGQLAKLNSSVDSLKEQAFNSPSLVEMKQISKNASEVICRDSQTTILTKDGALFIFGEMNPSGSGERSDKLKKIWKNRKNEEPQRDGQKQKLKNQVSYNWQTFVKLCAAKEWGGCAISKKGDLVFYNKFFNAEKFAGLSQVKDAFVSDQKVFALQDQGVFEWDLGFLLKNGFFTNKQRSNLDRKLDVKSYPPKFYQFSNRVKFSQFIRSPDGNSFALYAQTEGGEVFQEKNLILQFGSRDQRQHGGLIDSSRFNPNSFNSTIQNNFNNLNYSQSSSSFNTGSHFYGANAQIKHGNFINQYEASNREFTKFDFFSPKKSILAGANQPRINNSQNQKSFLNFDQVGQSRSTNNLRSDKEKSYSGLVNFEQNIQDTFLKINRNLGIEDSYGRQQDRSIERLGKKSITEGDQYGEEMSFRKNGNYLNSLGGFHKNRAEGIKSTTNSSSYGKTFTFSSQNNETIKRSQNQSSSFFGPSASKRDERTKKELSGNDFEAQWSNLHKKVDVQQESSENTKDLTYFLSLIKSGKDSLQSGQYGGNSKNNNESSYQRGDSFYAYPKGSFLNEKQSQKSNLAGQAGGYSSINLQLDQDYIGRSLLNKSRSNNFLNSFKTLARQNERLTIDGGNTNRSFFETNFLQDTRRRNQVASSSINKSFSLHNSSQLQQLPKRQTVFDSSFRLSMPQQQSRNKLNDSQSSQPRQLLNRSNNILNDSIQSRPLVRGEFERAWGALNKSREELNRSNLLGKSSANNSFCSDKPSRSRTSSVHDQPPRYVPAAKALNSSTSQIPKSFLQGTTDNGSFVDNFSNPLRNSRSGENRGVQMNLNNSGIGRLGGLSDFGTKLRSSQSPNFLRESSRLNISNNLDLNASMNNSMSQNTLFKSRRGSFGLDADDPTNNNLRRSGNEYKNTNNQPSGQERYNLLQSGLDSLGASDKQPVDQLQSMLNQEIEDYSPIQRPARDNNQMNSINSGDLQTSKIQEGKSVGNQTSLGDIQNETQINALKDELSEQKSENEKLKNMIKERNQNSKAHRSNKSSRNQSSSAVESASNDDLEDKKNRSKKLEKDKNALLSDGSILDLSCSEGMNSDFNHEDEHIDYSSLSPEEQQAHLNKEYKRSSHQFASNNSSSSNNNSSKQIKTTQKLKDNQLQTSDQTQRANQQQISGKEEDNHYQEDQLNGADLRSSKMIQSNKQSTLSSEVQLEKKNSAGSDNYFANDDIQEDKNQRGEDANQSKQLTGRQNQSQVFKKKLSQENDQINQNMDQIEYQQGGSSEQELLEYPNKQSNQQITKRSETLRKSNDNQMINSQNQLRGTTAYLNDNEIEQQNNLDNNQRNSKMRQSGQILKQEESQRQGSNDSSQKANLDVQAAGGSSRSLKQSQLSNIPSKNQEISNEEQQNNQNNRNNCSGQQSQQRNRQIQGQPEGDEMGIQDGFNNDNLGRPQQLLNSEINSKQTNINQNQETRDEIGRNLIGNSSGQQQLKGGKSSTTKDDQGIYQQEAIQQNNLQNQLPLGQQNQTLGYPQNYLQQGEEGSQSTYQNQGMKSSLIGQVKGLEKQGSSLSGKFDLKTGNINGRSSNLIAESKGRKQGGNSETNNERGGDQNEEEEQIAQYFQQKKDEEKLNQKELGEINFDDNLVIEQQYLVDPEENLNYQQYPQGFNSAPSNNPLSKSTNSTQLNRGASPFQQQNQQGSYQEQAPQELNQLIDANELQEYSSPNNINDNHYSHFTSSHNQQLRSSSTGFRDDLKGSYHPSQFMKQSQQSNYQQDQQLQGQQGYPLIAGNEPLSSSKQQLARSYSGQPRQGSYDQQERQRPPQMTMSSYESGSFIKPPQANISNLDPKLLRRSRTGQINQGNDLDSSKQSLNNSRISNAKGISRSSSLRYSDICQNFNDKMTKTHIAEKNKGYERATGMKLSQYADPNRSRSNSQMNCSQNNKSYGSANRSMSGSLRKSTYSQQKAKDSSSRKILPEELNDQQNNYRRSQSSLNKSYEQTDFIDNVAAPTAYQCVSPNNNQQLSQKQIFNSANTYSPIEVVGNSNLNSNYQMHGNAGPELEQYGNHVPDFNPSSSNIRTSQFKDKVIIQKQSTNPSSTLTDSQVQNTVIPLKNEQQSLIQPSRPQVQVINNTRQSGLASPIQVQTNPSNEKGLSNQYMTVSSGFGQQQASDLGNQNEFSQKVATKLSGTYQLKQAHILPVTEQKLIPTYEDNNNDNQTQETRVTLLRNQNNLPCLEGNPQMEAIKESNQNNHSQSESVVVKTYLQSHSRNGSQTQFEDQDQGLQNNLSAKLDKREQLLNQGNEGQLHPYKPQQSDNEMKIEELDTKKDQINNLKCSNQFAGYGQFTEQRVPLLQSNKRDLEDQLLNEDQNYYGPSASFLQQSTGKQYQPEQIMSNSKFMFGKDKSPLTSIASSNRQAPAHQQNDSSFEDIKDILDEKRAAERQNSLLPQSTTSGKLNQALSSSMSRPLADQQEQNIYNPSFKFNEDYQLPLQIQDQKYQVLRESAMASIVQKKEERDSQINNLIRDSSPFQEGEKYLNQGEKDENQNTSIYSAGLLPLPSNSTVFRLSPDQQQKLNSQQQQEAAFNNIGFDLAPQGQAQQSSYRQINDFGVGGVAVLNREIARKGNNNSRVEMQAERSVSQEQNQNRNSQLSPNQSLNSIPQRKELSIKPQLEKSVYQEYGNQNPSLIASSVTDYNPNNSQINQDRPEIKQKQSYRQDINSINEKPKSTFDAHQNNQSKYHDETDLKNVENQTLTFGDVYSAERTSPIRNQNSNGSSFPNSFSNQQLQEQQQLPPVTSIYSYEAQKAQQQPSQFNTASYQNKDESQQNEKPMKLSFMDYKVKDQQKKKEKSLILANNQIQKEAFPQTSSENKGLNEMKVSSNDGIKNQPFSNEVPEESMPLSNQIARGFNQKLSNPISQGIQNANQSNSSNSQYGQESTSGLSQVYSSALHNKNVSDPLIDSNTTNSNSLNNLRKVVAQQKAIDEQNEPIRQSTKPKGFGEFKKNQAVDKEVIALFEKEVSQQNNIAQKGNYQGDQFYQQSGSLRQNASQTELMALANFKKMGINSKISIVLALKADKFLLKRKFQTFQVIKNWVNSLIIKSNLQANEKQSQPIQIRFKCNHLQKIVEGLIFKKNREFLVEFIVKLRKNNLINSLSSSRRGNNIQPQASSRSSFGFKEDMSIQEMSNEQIVLIHKINNFAKIVKRIQTKNKLAGFKLICFFSAASPNHKADSPNGEEETHLKQVDQEIISSNFAGEPSNPILQTPERKQRKASQKLAQRATSDSPQRLALLQQNTRKSQQNSVKLQTTSQLANQEQPNQIQNLPFQQQTSNGQLQQPLNPVPQNLRNNYQQEGQKQLSSELQPTFESQSGKIAEEENAYKPFHVPTYADAKEFEPDMYSKFAKNLSSDELLIVDQIEQNRHSKQNSIKKGVLGNSLAHNLDSLDLANQSQQETNQRFERYINQCNPNLNNSHANSQSSFKPYDRHYLRDSLPVQGSLEYEQDIDYNSLLVQMQENYQPTPETLALNQSQQYAFLPDHLQPGHLHRKKYQTMQVAPIDDYQKVPSKGNGEKRLNKQSLHNPPAQYLPGYERVIHHQKQVIAKRFQNVHNSQVTGRELSLSPNQSTLVSPQRSLFVSQSVCNVNGSLSFHQSPRSSVAIQATNRLYELAVTKQAQEGNKLLNSNSFNASDQMFAPSTQKNNRSQLGSNNQRSYQSPGQGSLKQSWNNN